MEKPQAGSTTRRSAPLIVSIGYERRGLEELLSLLRQQGVVRLIDVRAVPSSRRSEYRKDALTKSLSAVGIEYVHIGEAGNPYRASNHDIKTCLALYRRHLIKTPTALEAVEDAITAVRSAAVFCYERQHRLCHRSVVLDALQEKGRELNLVLVE